MIRIVLLSILTLVVQRILGMPGLPSWPPEILLPAVWIVAPPLLHHERGWPYHALFLGLGWDLLLEPVVGPGGIAWTAAALSMYALAGLVADRSAKAWVGFGAVCAAVVIVVRHLALFPLGLAAPLSLQHAVRSILLTALWCGFVGVVVSLDLPARWRRYKTRRLR